MNIIASDQQVSTNMLSNMLESYDCPAILVTKHYVIIATNRLYQQQFGSIDTNHSHHCFEVSHGYSVPCDQAGEDCPLAAAQQSRHKERVLHIHQTPRGKEHVDVEMIPIYDNADELIFFVELLRAIPLVSNNSAENSMVGSSSTFNTMIEKITRVGGSKVSVLLLGESGTGKELAASAIHQGSDRNSAALVSLECAGLSDALFESELFGHVKGAFTGAHTHKKGLVEQAHGGTLFLDEIGDVPLSMQVKLLRLLESGTFRPVGSTVVKNADFRLICATHKNLQEMIDAGLFRQDLYYRINVFPIRIPSLSQRLGDIPLIAKQLLSQLSTQYFTQTLNQSLNQSLSQSSTKTHSKELLRLTDCAISELMTHQYRGNIRELRNLLTRAIIFSDTNAIEGKHIKQAVSEDIPHTNNTVSESINPCSQTLNTNNIESNNPLFNRNPAQWVDLKTLESQYLHLLMSQNQNNRQTVADIAGISLRSLYRKLKDPRSKEY